MIESFFAWLGWTCKYNWTAVAVWCGPMGVETHWLHNETSEHRVTYRAYDYD